MPKRSKDDGGVKARASTKKASPNNESKPVAAGPSRISEELRQAVKDLGGDEEDLALIQGVDEDDEEISLPAKSKGKGKETSMDEKSLRKALGEFMKGLDLPAVVPVSDSEDDEGSEEESGEDEGEDEDEDDEDKGDSIEDEEDKGDSIENEASDSDEAESAAAPGPSVKGAAKQATKAEPAPKSVPRVEPLSISAVKTHIKPAGPDQSSGTNVAPSPSWSSLIPELSPPSQPLKAIPTAKLNTLRQKGNQFLETLPPLNRASSSSDAAFISQILQSGTHQDKLSALVLLVRESPIHAVKELNRLRTMAGWKEDGLGGGGNKDQRIAVLKALADWWVSGGGKESGKLRYFADQPLLAHPGVTDRHLLVFAFEDYLKKWFFSLLQVLEFLSHDTLPYIRTQALHIIFQLLSGNAEQEQNLLRLGVNKLGDTERSVASKTSHHILQLLQVHPAMKAVVARETSALILKPSSGQEPAKTHIRFDDDKAKEPNAKNEGTNHARYYGIITLNQITLTSKDHETAARMVELYFEIFREILGKSEKDDVDLDPEARKAAAVEKAAGKVEKWRGRRKGAKPKGGRKTPTEADALVESGEAKLVAAVLTGINRALPFAKLDESLLSKYMETLFKITHRGTFNTSIQSLNLIFTVSRTQASVADRFYRTLYDSLLDERLLTSSKQAMYLNLLIKALKADSNQSRVMAFVKRLLQMLGMQQPPFICGALYLLGELFSVTPGLRRMLLEPEDDEEEHFVDADRKVTTAEAESTAKASSSKVYDGKKREPQYANADTSCLWELLPFVDHFHPSISLQATQLLNSQPLTGSSDISLNTLVSFLDRFVYRNPKKNIQPKGASIMQPAAASERSGMIVKNKGARIGESGYVNSEAFWRKKIEDVPADQLFFHKFFASKLSKVDAASKVAKSEGAGDEEESEAGSELDSDEEEEEVWKAMKASMPKAGDEMDISDDDSDPSSDDSGSPSDEVVEASSVAGDSNHGASNEIIDDEDEDVDESGSDSPFPDFADEEDDIIADEDMPDITLHASPSPDPEDVDADTTTAAGKRKRNADRKERRKKRKEMPVFGSYEEYAKLIEQDEEDSE